MPSFRHLYIYHLKEGKGSAYALKLPDSPADSRYEVIPTPEAQDLVDYILSLKKDSPIPGQVVAETTKK